MLNLLFILLATLPQGQEPAPLTFQSILDAHQQGVSAQTLLNVIASAASVAPASETDLAALLQAGVPGEVVERFKARSVISAAAPSTGPEDPRLKDIVRLVKSGLSEDLVRQQIQFSGELYKPSVNDLLYLKENQVPESVIRELIRTNPAGAFNKTESSEDAKAKTDTKSFKPLLLMKGFMNRTFRGL